MRHANGRLARAMRVNAWPVQSINTHGTPTDAASLGAKKTASKANTKITSEYFSRGNM